MPKLVAEKVPHGKNSFAPPTAILYPLLYLSLPRWAPLSPPLPDRIKSHTPASRKGKGEKKPPPAGTNYFAINLTAGTQRVNTGTQIVNTGTQIVATSTQIAYFFSFPRQPPPPLRLRFTNLCRGVRTPASSVGRQTDRRASRVRCASQRQSK